MAKFDLEKYWDFRVWVKSQIAQLRALLSEHQQNGGGGGTGGGGDFDPNGTYPNMSVGTATKATSADKAATADYATSADTAKKAAIADSALFADSAITADKATTADYATTAGQATTAESAKTATNADRATTAGYATTAGVAESAEHAATASLATRATVADSADSATHADSADSATIANTAMKAEYATNAGNAERATIANSAESAKSANSASTATLAINLQNAPELTTNNEQIVVKVGGKTSNALTVPYAQRADFATDLSGRVEATPEVFTYRPSAGDNSIKDDNAFIRRVKGNSVVWNPMISSIIRRENFEGVTTYYDPTTNECVIENISRSSNYSSGSNRLAIQPATNFVNGHKYILVCNKNITGVGVYDQNSPQSFQSVNTIFSATNNSAIYFRIDRTFDFASQCPVGETLRLKIQLYDLTTMLGAGNEPATVEEFRALYPDSYYPYNAGELRNLMCGGIKTVGFNEFNGTYARVLPNESYYLGGSYTSLGFAKELGGATETISIPSNRIYTPTQLGYIYATGTDICINLHHTGYRDGEYAPYKEVTHALPLSQITNGQPLRKAGSVYDEINETEYIRRVGVRGYATGDKDDATLLTDGTYTNYPLAEPIVKPIETPIDFNYYVEDFGTEEAILAEDSAPFSADIIYQFNAVDNIRQNRISIQKLNDIFSGSKGEYVRADGSWGYIADLKGNFFVKPTLKRIRTGISELSDTIQIIHPYLTEHVGDAKIVLMAVKRRGGTYYDRATNAKGRRKKRKAWGELHYAAMPNTEINHNTIEMPNGASFEAWQGVILTACGRIPEGLENAREPYNVNVASEDLADFFAANGAIFVGKTPVIRLGVALRIPNPNFIDYGNGNKMWDYNDVTGKWEYKYLYSDVAEVVVKSQMLRTGGYALGLELV